MTNREAINQLSNKKFSKLLIRYTNCAVCVLRSECEHVIYGAPGETEHTNDKSCAERIEKWLAEELKQPEKGSK